MRIRIPERVFRLYDRTMDAIAFAIFPAPRKIGLRLFGWEVTHLDLALVGYTLGIGIGLSLILANWLWLPATIAGMFLAAMLLAWFF